MCVLLPAQIVVGDLRGIDLRGESVAEIDVRHAVEGQVLRVADLGVSGLTHAGAEFQVVEPFHVAQEALVAHAPAHGGSREITPPGVGGEARRTVAADRGRNHVTPLVGVLRTHEPRGERVSVFVVVGLFQVDGLALRGADLVVALDPRADDLRGLDALFFGFVDRHGVDRVVAEGADEGELVGDRPVEVGLHVVLRLGVRRGVEILEAAQGDVRRTVVVADVGVVVAAGRELVLQSLDELIGDVGIAQDVDLLAHVVDFERQRHGVEHLVGLGVPAVDAQESVHVPVVGAVGVVDREDRGRHQRRGDHAVAVVLRVGGDVVGLRIRGREADAVFQPVALAVDVGPQAVTFEIRADDRTFAVEVVGADVVAQRLGAARNRHGVLGRVGRAEDGVLPVGVGHRAGLVLKVGRDERIDAVVGLGAVLIGVVDRTRRDVEQIGAVAGLLEDRCEFVGVEHVDRLRDVRDAELAVVAHDGAFARAALGRDEDDAARAARTVDRRRRGVLEHFEALDVAAFEVREGPGVARNAVDDIERVVARRGRLDAADADRDVAVGLAAQREHLHARHLGGHGVAEVGRRHVGEILGLDRRDGRRHVALVLHAVAHDHHVVHGDRLAFQRNVGLRLALGERHFDLVVADERVDQHGVGLPDVDGVFAGGVGRRARRGAFQDDGGADHRRAAFVGHAALHRAAGVSRGTGLRFPPPFGCEDDFQSLNFHIHIGKHLGDDRGDAAVDGLHRHPFVGVDVGVDVGERVLAVGFDALQQLLDGNVLRIDGDGRDLGRSRGGRHRAEEDRQEQMPADPFQNVEFIHDSFGLCLIRFFK